MKKLNYKDLLVKLKEAQEKLFELKVQLGNQQLKNYMQIKDLRKSIAQIKTVMAEKRENGEQMDAMTIHNNTDAESKKVVNKKNVERVKVKD